MKTIGFHSNQLSITGTEVALYDYAKCNETILGNRSFILYNASNPLNQPEALEKFSQRFEVVPYRSKNEMEEVLRTKRATLMYALKGGKRDGLVSETVPTMVHAVFPTNPLQRHGASYAYVSEWLSEVCSRGKIPAVPHIVEMPQTRGDLRRDLNIPESSKVFGCYGGKKSFDVVPAIRAVHKVLENLNDTFFLFMNIEKFVDHPRAIFLPGSVDLFFKSRFINTCDAMLHARRQGESFGLACGEFSLMNKPVITYKLGKHRHHVRVLGNKGIYFSGWRDLYEIIRLFDLPAIRAFNWDQYSALYNKDAVMERFDRFLIQPALRNGCVAHPDIDINAGDLLAYFSLKSRWAMDKVFNY